jgi:hypothetical protein
MGAGKSRGVARGGGRERERERSLSNTAWIPYTESPSSSFMVLVTYATLSYLLPLFGHGRDSLRLWPQRGFRDKQIRLALSGLGRIEAIFCEYSITNNKANNMQALVEQRCSQVSQWSHGCKISPGRPGWRVPPPENHPKLISKFY